MINPMTEVSILLFSLRLAKIVERQFLCGADSYTIFREIAYAVKDEVYNDRLRSVTNK